jgi:hypothetical protein
MADMRIKLNLDASTSGAEAIKALIADLLRIQSEAKAADKAAQSVKKSGSPVAKSDTVFAREVGKVADAAAEKRFKSAEAVAKKEFKLIKEAGQFAQAEEVKRTKLANIEVAQREKISAASAKRDMAFAREVGKVADAEAAKRTKAADAAAKKAANIGTKTVPRGLIETAAYFVKISILANIIRTAVMAIPRVLAAVVTEGIRINAEFESIKFGIASVINAQLRLGDASGNQYEGIEKYNAALKLSEEWFNKIRIAALKTQATTEQLSLGFQTAVSVGASQGITDLKQIFDLTIGITNAATAMNISMDMVPVAIRAVLTGRMATHNVVARTLGITLAQNNAWKAEGTLVENLTKRLSPFTAAAEISAKSFKVMSSNILEAFQILSADVTSGLFSSLKVSMNKYFWDLFDFKNLSLASRFQPLVDGLKGLFTSLGEMVASTVDGIMSALEKINTWIKEHPTKVMELQVAWDTLLKTISSSMGEIFRTGTDKSGAFTTVLSRVMNTISLIIAAFTDAYRIATTFMDMAFWAPLSDIFKSLGILFREGPLAAIREFERVGNAATNAFKSIFTTRMDMAKVFDNVDATNGKLANTKKSIDAIADAIKRMDTSNLEARDIIKLPKVQQDESLLSAREVIEKKKGTGTQVLGAAWAPPEKKVPSTTNAEIREDNLVAKHKLALLKEYYALRNKLEADSLKLGEISIEEYYTRQLERIEEESKAEIEIKRDQIKEIEKSSAKTAADEKKKAFEVLKINQEIELIQVKTDKEKTLSGLAQLDALKTYRTEALNLADELARKQVTDPRSSKDRVAAQYEATIAKLKANATPADEALLVKLLGAWEAEQDLEDFTLLYTTKLSSMEAQLAIVEQSEASGAIRSIEANRQRIAVYQQWIPVLQEINDKQIQAAATSEEPGLMEAAERTRLSIVKLKDSLIILKDKYAELKQGAYDSISEGLIAALDSIGNHTSSVSDAFRNMALSIVESIQQIITRMIVMRMMQAAMSMFSGPSNASNWGSGKSPGMAGGGLVEGPGTSTSDSIPCRLSDGEYVVRAVAVRKLGLPFMDAINGLKSRPNIAFAEGGPVQSTVTPTRAEPGTTKMEIGLEEGLFVKHLQTPKGERAILEVLGRNPNYLRSMTT